MTNIMELIEETEIEVIEDEDDGYQTVQEPEKEDDPTTPAEYTRMLTQELRGNFYKGVFALMNSSAMGTYVTIHVEELSEALTNSKYMTAIIDGKLAPLTEKIPEPVRALAVVATHVGANMHINSPEERKAILSSRKAAEEGMAIELKKGGVEEL